MKVSIYFVALAVALAACSTPPEAPPPPQAVRVVEVRTGPVVEGRRHLAEVVPARAVDVVAQVAGTVMELAPEGELLAEGSTLARVGAPDVAARVGRVRAERQRAERERDLACDQLRIDRALAAAGDLPPVQLDRSETACSSAELAVGAAQQAEREAGVASARANEVAPFRGQVLAHLVDVGQTVMPGKPMLRYGSEARQLRLRLPEADLQDISLGTPVIVEAGSGRVVAIGAQAAGPGRLVEVTAELDAPTPLRVGATTTVTLVMDEQPDAIAVPRAALGEDAAGPYVLVVEEDRLQRLDVRPGPQQDGWVAISPGPPPGSRVAVGALAGLDPDRPVLAVSP